jgi:transposase InsO family protein
VNVYPFIEAEKVAVRNVARTCAMLTVSRSAFYEWRHHESSARAIADAKLAGQIAEIHKVSRGTYGSPRVTVALNRAGVRASKKRVARLMAKGGLTGRTRKRKVRTTISDPAAGGTMIDRLGRSFNPTSCDLDRTYVGDITYIRTHEGWLYLATVIDLASQRIVGFAMADHMRASLVCDALRMAIELRHPAPGFIFHSDRGSQYTSKDFRDLLTEHKGLQSLSRPRQCWDNAVAESFFATLKMELVYRLVLPTREVARRAIFEFIEVFYNRIRLDPASAATLFYQLRQARIYRQLKSPRLVCARSVNAACPVVNHLGSGQTGANVGAVFGRWSVAFQNGVGRRRGIGPRCPGRQITQADNFYLSVADTGLCLCKRILSRFHLCFRVVAVASFLGDHRWHISQCLRRVIYGRLIPFGDSGIAGADSLPHGRGAEGYALLQCAASLCELGDLLVGFRYEPTKLLDHQTTPLLFGLICRKPTALFGELLRRNLVVTSPGKFRGKSFGLFCKLSGLAHLFDRVFRDCGLDFFNCSLCIR